MQQAHSMRRSDNVSLTLELFKLENSASSIA